MNLLTRRNCGIAALLSILSAGTPLVALAVPLVTFTTGLTPAEEHTSVFDDPESSYFWVDASPMMLVRPGGSTWQRDVEADANPFWDIARNRSTLPAFRRGRASAPLVLISFDPNGEITVATDQPGAMMKKAQSKPKRRPK